MSAECCEHHHHHDHEEMHELPRLELVAAHIGRACCVGHCSHPEHQGVDLALLESMMNDTLADDDEDEEEKAEEKEKRTHKPYKRQLGALLLPAQRPKLTL